MGRNVWLGVWAVGLCCACSDAQGFLNLQGSGQSATLQPTAADDPTPPPAEDPAQADAPAPPALPTIAADSGAEVVDAGSSERITTVDAGRGSDEPPHPTGPVDPALCDAPRGDVAKAPSQQAFIDLLVGDWYLCSTSSVFCSDPPRGISIRRDGTWSDFEAEGRAADGSWEVYDLTEVNGPGTYQLRLERNGGFFGTLPSISADGSHLQLRHYSCQGDYIRAGARAERPVKVLQGITVEPRPASAAQPAGQQVACDVAPTRSMQFASKQEYETEIAGIWHTCGQGSSQFAALELTSDHRWYELFADADGTLWRAAEFDRRGEWNWLDHRNGQYVYQLALHFESNSGLSGTTTISADGLRMRLSYGPPGIGTFPTEYARSVAQLPPQPVMLRGIAVEATPLRTGTCAASSGPLTYFTAKAELDAALLGAWALCGPAMCENSRAGVEFAGDGSWYELYADDDGKLWRAISWEHQGRWETNESSGLYFLGMYIDGSGIMSPQPMLYGAPEQRRLRSPWESDCNTHYAQVPDLAAGP